MLTSVIVTKRLYVVHLIFKHIKRLQDIYTFKIRETLAQSYQFNGALSYDGAIDFKI